MLSFWTIGKGHWFCGQVGSVPDTLSLSISSAWFLLSHCFLCSITHTSTSNIHLLLNHYPIHIHGYISQIENQMPFVYSPLSWRGLYSHYWAWCLECTIDSLQDTDTLCQVQAGYKSILGSFHTVIPSFCCLHCKICHYAQWPSIFLWIIPFIPAQFWGFPFCVVWWFYYHVWVWFLWFLWRVSILQVSYYFGAFESNSLWGRSMRH